MLLTSGAELVTNLSLHHAARRRSADTTVLPIMRLLLDQNVLDVNSIEFDHDDEAQQDLIRLSGRIPGTVLHSAVESGSVERVRLVLERGGDPRIGNMEGETALDVARRFHHTKVESLLLEWLGRIEEDAKEPWVLVDEEFAVLGLEDGEQAQGDTSRLNEIDTFPR
jgi:hypothetical protein